MSSSAASVAVRMYNVGFGDSFLLTFPTSDRPRKVLVDCGVHTAGGSTHPIGDVAKQIVADATESDGVARLDLVIATHRHQDHVSGFGDAVWKDVHVGEVWMPWTEDPDDPDAAKIREAQSGAALKLAQALRLAEAPEAVLGLALNSLTNEKAMTTLHSGFAGSPARHYLPANGKEGAPLLTPVLPGVTIHPLGPSRDPDVIRDMNPPEGGGYLELVRGQTSRNGVPFSPFRGRWSISPSDFLADSDTRPLAPSSAERETLNRLGSGDGLALAVALDQAVNGTSLMLVFEMGDAWLLFPGDAQWGTWNAALKDPAARALLSKTVFYKVGHHGSHNATPKEFVENVLPSGFSAMVSTRPIAMWKNIPKPELLNALVKKSPRLVRSDKLKSPVPSGFTKQADFWAETRIPV